MKLLEKDGLFIVVPKSPQDSEKLWSLEGKNIGLDEVSVKAELQKQ